MIEYKRNIPIKAQTGRVLRIMSFDEKADQAKKENERDLAISQLYFDQAPSIQNLARGIYHWARGSEWSPFSRSEDPDDYKYNMGTAPVPGVGKKAAVGVAKNIKDRYVKLGKYLAERQARNASKAAGAATKNKTTWQKVNNAGTNVTKTIKRIFRETKDDNFGNVFGIGYKGRNRIRVAVPVLVGGPIIGGIMGRIGGAATKNAGRFVGAFQKGFNEGAGISNPSTNQDTTKTNQPQTQNTTNQSQIQQPTAQPQYKTLDSLRRAAIQASIELVDSINNAN